MRLAWFTPLPPVTSGIARYSAELLPWLTPAHQIDVFIDGQPDEVIRSGAEVSVFDAHDFVWKHFRQPYDLIVYELGNAPCHDYMWAYMVRYPGLVTLHDGQLHHARARCLLQQKREEDYRAEFRFNHPGANPDLVELGIAGLLGSLTYLWPMVRVVVESARLLIVHNEWLASQIRLDHPEARLRVVEMGVPLPAARAEARETVRKRHGIPADAVLFTAFGKVTPEKRISQAIQALASIAEALPHAHLLLAGETVNYYDPRAEAARLRVSERVAVAGFVVEEELAAYLAAADVCLCLRWPSSRETSASWLRCLAAGKATIVTDLVHTVEVPALDPRDWRVLHAPALSRVEGPALSPVEGPLAPADESTEPVVTEPACVSLDILDEDHSLRLAMRRLGTDAQLRDALGRSARRLWLARFTLERMVQGYREAIDAACAVPVPDKSMRTRLPRHFSTDGTEHAARLLGEMGLAPATIAEIWSRN